MRLKTEIESLSGWPLQYHLPAQLGVEGTADPHLFQSFVIDCDGIAFAGTLGGLLLGSGFKTSNDLLVKKGT